MAFSHVIHHLSATRVWPFPHDFFPFTTSPVPAPAPFSQMPLELVLAVIEAACDGADDRARVSLLTSCALVCRTWSHVSQRLLFASVSLKSQRAFEAFVAAVDPAAPHGVSLAAAVRSLNVVVDHNQPSGLHQNALALAVSVCPNLAHLGISLYGCAEPGSDVVGAPDLARLRRDAPSFDEPTLALLRSGPKISSLHFDNWSENHTAIFQLLAVWPSLRYLSIGGTPPQHLHDSPPPFPCALRGVRFNFQTTPSTDFMRWLLHSSSASIETLRFDRDPCPDVLEYLVTAHANTLRSITLPGYDSPALVGLATKAPHLRELRTESPSFSTAQYTQLGKQVEHLSFGLDRSTPLASIIDMIKSRDTLSSVTIQLWESGENHRLLSSLKIACMYRGVDLTITSDLRQFRTMSIPTKSVW